MSSSAFNREYSSADAGDKSIEVEALKESITANPPKSENEMVARAKSFGITKAEVMQFKKKPTSPISNGAPLATTQQQIANVASTDLAKEGSSAVKKIVWIPYLGYGAGLVLGCYVASKKNSGTWGYLGWAALFGTVGATVGGYALTALIGKQADDILSGKGKTK